MLRDDGAHGANRSNFPASLLVLINKWKQDNQCEARRIKRPLKILNESITVTKHCNNSNSMYVGGKGLPSGSKSRESVCNRPRRSSGEGNGNPF